MLQVRKALTDRWTQLKHHEEQNRLWHSKSRFKVIPAGRRSGKTELAKRKLVLEALQVTDWPNARFFAGAPVWRQAKAIFWKDLKDLVPKRFLAGSPSESELVIRLINGAEIYVFGMDKPERIEGQPWNGGILDEYGNMKSHTWGTHVRPALSDRRGWCWLTGVPEGRNHYYRTFKSARRALNKEWDAFHWISADILPPEEIEAAKQDLDELTYQQEYEATFVNFQGRAYYAFDETLHCGALTYDPKQPLILCFDFNVAPGVAVICQEQKFPNGVQGTGVLGEVYIPRNSNTPSVCKKILSHWGNHHGYVFCYGDATGGSRGSAKVQGSDWDLIHQVLDPHFGSRIYYEVPRSNPTERARINAVNSRLKSSSGTIRLMVDAQKSSHTIMDFEGVRLLEGGSGEIDKRNDPELTHLTDALGYYIVRKFPVRQYVASEEEQFWK